MENRRRQVVNDRLCFKISFVRVVIASATLPGETSTRAALARASTVPNVRMTQFEFLTQQLNRAPHRATRIAPRRARKRRGRKRLH